VDAPTGRPLRDPGRMRPLVLLCAAALGGMAARLPAASLPDSWPAAGDRPAADWKKLAAEIPPAARPALELTQIYVEALEGRPAAQWRPRLRAILANPSTPPAFLEAARMWEARARMDEIRTALKNYFKKKVAFPPDLGAVIDGVPEGSRQDPWDHPWQYRLSAPAGLPQLKGKDYELHPAGMEGLTAFHQLARTPFLPPEVKYERLEIGGSPGVKVQRASGSPAILQPGGSVDGLHLIHLDNARALWCQYGYFFITR
jgi:hypothetical protein